MDTKYGHKGRTLQRMRPAYRPRIPRHVESPHEVSGWFRNFEIQVATHTVFSDEKIPDGPAPLEIQEPATRSTRCHQSRRAELDSNGGNQQTQKLPSLQCVMSSNDDHQTLSDETTPPPQHGVYVVPWECSTRQTNHDDDDDIDNIKPQRQQQRDCRQKRRKNNTDEDEL